MESAFFTVADWVANPRSNFNSAKKPSKRPAAAADGSIVLFCAASYGGRFQTRDH